MARRVRAGSSGSAVTPAELERCLAELGLQPEGRVEREDDASWDLRLDGRRRFDVRLTVILDRAVGAIVWVPLAPPIMDYHRKAYRRLLRWNDEFPFAKFSLTPDERPLLAIEVAGDRLDRDELGTAIARALVICDLLLEEVAGWAWIGGRVPDWSGRTSRGAALIDRFADRLGELAAVDG